MYAPFFGLQHAPFSIAPDPRYLYMSERHREALAHLLYGLDAGGGFVLLTGEVGTGKTTVCRCFLEQIPAHCNVAYIFNPKLTVGELLRSICDEFGIAHKPAVAGAETVKDCIDPLNAALLQSHAAGRNNVLIIDEAQNLSADVLEQLRLLTNLETSERKLLQIILIGQPELRAMVARPSMEQLAQRVIARFHLDALTPQETTQYIAHRLSIAGLAGPLPFQPRALQRVHALSHGVPRRINLLCDRALLGAYAAGVREVSPAIVNGAALEVFDAPGVAAAAARSERGRWPAWALAGLGGVAGAAVVATAAWALGAWSVPPGDTALQSGAGPSATNAASAPAAGPASMPSQAGTRATALALPPGLQTFLGAQPAGDAAAWRRLATAWGAALPEGSEPCGDAPADGLRCYRNGRADLALLRQLDRPAVVALSVPQAARAASASGVAPAPAPVWVVLRQVQGDNATLEGAGRTVQMPLSVLAQLWDGDMGTLWRAPPVLNAQDLLDDSPAAREWLDAQLASASGARVGSASSPANSGSSATPPGPDRLTPAQRRAAVHQFQRAQGLAPDGRAGPLTLMLLNRANGVNEPRLRPGA